MQGARLLHLSTGPATHSDTYQYILPTERIYVRCSLTPVEKGLPQLLEEDGPKIRNFLLGFGEPVNSFRSLIIFRGVRHTARRLHFPLSLASEKQAK
ncbi:uncharacterized protein LOC132669294 isoform X2 [Panthera onca]